MYLFLIASLYAAFSPVMLVPGIGGSQMRMKLENYTKVKWWCFSNLEWFDFWISLTALQPENIDCVNDQFSLHIDNSTGLYSNTTGVYVHVVEGLAGIAYLDDTFKDEAAYFHDMIAYLENGGYTQDLNLHAATYDWRLGPDGLAQVGYFKSLQQQLEDTVVANGERALLVSHSLGSLVCQSFLSLMDEGWVANHVKAWYALGPPFGGSAKMTQSIITGYTFGIPDWLLPLDYFHDIQASAASGITLLPQAFAFGSDFAVVKTPSKTYTPSVSSVRSMLKDLGLVNTIDIFDWMQVHNAQTNQLPAPPGGLPITIFYGSGMNTLSALHYDTDFHSDFNEDISKEEYMDGDGTVATVSATAVNQWPGYELGNINMYPVTASHFGLVSDPTVMAKVLAAGNVTDVNKVVTA